MVMLRVGYVPYKESDVNPVTLVILVDLDETKAMAEIAHIFAEEQESAHIRAQEQDEACDE